MSTLDRRQFLATTAGAAAALLTRPAASAAPVSAPKIIDTNVLLGRWPFRRLPLDETPRLVSKLREQGVSEAWAGSFDALLHKDLGAVNARLATEARASDGFLVPFGAVNPMLPDWEEELRRCAEVHGMRGIRLHPNYHGYKLDDPAFARLLDAAMARKLLVQITLVMEDERTLHPLVNVPAVETAPLVPLLQARPAARVQVLNAFRTLRARPLTDLAAAGARFEIATLEGVEGITKLLAQIDPGRVCFGSYSPFFYFESALLKLRESVLTEAQTQAICVGNAQSLRA